MYKLFIDESGNSGTINTRRKDSQTFNFIDQKYFTLGGLLIPSESEKFIRDDIEDILTKNQITGELKFSNGAHRKKFKSLLQYIEEMLKKYNVELFFDISNKKFKIAQYITDYCVLPAYDMNEKMINISEFHILKSTIANIIYETVQDEILIEFLILANGEHVIEDLIIFLNKLNDSVESSYINQSIEETLDSVKSYKVRGIQKHNLFPLVDYTNNGKSVLPLSPNIDAFNSFMVSISHKYQSFKIVHDEQHQFSNSLTKWSQNENFGGIVDSISFVNSKECRILQIVDYLSGWINEHFKFSIYDSNEREYITQLITQKSNIVSYYTDTKNMLKNNYLIEYAELYQEFYKELKR